MSVSTVAVKGELVDSKEIVNWVAYRRICEKIKEELIKAERSGDETLIVSIWKYPKARPSEARRLKNC